jgi:dCTP deaminase
MAFWTTRDFIDNLERIVPSEHDREYLKKDFYDKKKSRLRENSLELSLGKQTFLSSKKELIELSEGNDIVKIEPGDFALLITEEKIHIPLECMAFISIKSKHKLSGLINISGFHVDPGFKGKLKFSVYNAGTTPVILRYKDPTFILFIADLKSEAERKGGDHWDQDSINLNEMMPLLGSGIPVHNLEKRVERIETLTKIFGGILVGIFLLLIRLILK